MVFPLTVFPPMSIGPRLPVMVNGPVTVLLWNVTPPRKLWPFVMLTGPVILLPAQDPPSPKVTMPVAPLIVTGPVMVAPQAVIEPGWVAVKGPVILAFCTVTEPPLKTFTGPVMVVPSTSTFCPAPMVKGAV